MVAEDRIVLGLRGVSVSYGDTPVLDGLDMAVADGQFVAVVGESGCGKSTLLNAIAGFLEYEGRISRPERVGVVFQDHAVFPWMSVEENVRFGIRDPGTLDHYLEMTGLQDKRRSYPYELSGGQVQRVALARTLAAQPDMILMDEPYGSLDIYTRDRMQRWLLDVWETEKKTIVLVTHSIEEAAFLADRVLVLKDGRISRQFKVRFVRPRDSSLRYSDRFMRMVRDISRSMNTGGD